MILEFRFDVVNDDFVMGGSNIAYFAAKFGAMQLQRELAFLRRLEGK